MARGKGKGNAGILNKPVTGTGANDVLAGSSAIINGGDGDDQITGSDLIERINAGDGDDFIFGGGGDDTIFGNDGTDTAIYTGSLQDAVLTAGKSNSYTLTTADGGTDTLKHIEFIQFDDFTYQMGVNNGVFTRADNATTNEDGSVEIDVLANDFDFEGDTFAITSYDAVSANGVAVTMNNGNFVYDASSHAAYQALGRDASTTDTFTYTVTDAVGNESTETVTVIIEGRNDAPTITGGDTSGNVSEDGVLTASGTLVAEDIDVGDELTWSVLNAGSYGSLSVDDDGNWTYTLDNDSASVQALNDGDNVSDTFTVQVSDGLETATEEVTVNIAGDSDSVTLDFDSGNSYVTADYGSHMYGYYQEDGFTLSWGSYDYDTSYYWYWNGYYYTRYYYSYGGDADYPLQDLNGDGNIELGVDADGSWYYGYDYFYGTLTQDNGEAFSIKAFDIINDGGGDNSGHVQLYGYAEDGTVRHYAINYDNGDPSWYHNVYNYNTGYYESSGYVTEQFVEDNLFEDVAYVDINIYSTDYFNYYYGYGDGIGIDNIEIA